MSIHTGKGRGFAHSNRKSQGLGSSGPANTRNWTAGGFTKLAAGLARVRGATGRCRIACGPGDSTTAGINATRLTSGPAALAARLATVWGVPVSTNSIIGGGASGTTAAAINAHDSRITYTGTPIGSSPNFGGNTLRLAVTGESWTLTFAQCDTIELYWDTGPGNGTFTLYLDGVSQGVQNCTGGSYVVNKTTLSGLSDTTHTVKFEWASGSTFVIGGIGYRSTVPGVDVINGGWPSSTSVNWNTATGISPRDGWLKIGADLSIIATGINDENAGADPNTSFVTNETALVTYGQGTVACDMLMVVPNWWTGGASVATQQAYQAAIKTISDSKSAPCYDFRTLYPSWQALQDAGGMGGNTIHPNATGYSLLWTPLADAIAVVVP